VTAKSLVLLGLLAIFARIAPVHAAESYDNCAGTIASLPATITTQGVWCIKQDLSTAVTSGSAITVNTNNVTIDCNGFKLGGLAAGAGTKSSGIYAANRVNLTVRHCNIRGFYVGVYLNGASSGGHLIEDNRFDGNTYYGMIVQGDGSVIRRNLVYNTGGSTAGVYDATGIFAQTAVDVIDNTVVGVTGSSGGNGNANGIYTSGLSDSTIQGNSVRTLAPSGTGHAYGIRNYTSDRLSIRDNELTGDSGSGSVGLYCTNGNGRAIGNDISLFATAISSCTDVRDNDTVP
jgi:hypothetical protein